MTMTKQEQTTMSQSPNDSRDSTAQVEQDEETLWAMDEAEETGAYYCAECELVSLEEGGPLYECSDDETIFTREDSADGSSHRCPTCNKFSSKIAEISCTGCCQTAVERVRGYECPVCGDVVLVEDWPDHKDSHRREV